MISPRLGVYDPKDSQVEAGTGSGLSDAESKGLRYALYGLIGVAIVFALL